jgi:hypothetical protein
VEKVLKMDEDAADLLQYVVPRCLGNPKLVGADLLQYDICVYVVPRCLGKLSKTCRGP